MPRVGDGVGEVKYGLSMFLLGVVKSSPSNGLSFSGEVSGVALDGDLEGDLFNAAVTGISGRALPIRRELLLLWLLSIYEVLIDPVLLCTLMTLLIVCLSPVWESCISTCMKQRLVCYCDMFATPPITLSFQARPSSFLINPISFRGNARSFH